MVMSGWVVCVGEVHDGWVVDHDGGSSLSGRGIVSIRSGSIGRVCVSLVG